MDDVSSLPYDVGASPVAYPATSHHSAYTAYGAQAAYDTSYAQAHGQGYGTEYGQDPYGQGATYASGSYDTAGTWGGDSTGAYATQTFDTGAFTTDPLGTDPLGADPVSTGEWTIPDQWAAESQQQTLAAIPVQPGPTDWETTSSDWGTGAYPADYRAEPEPAAAPHHDAPDAANAASSPSDAPDNTSASGDVAPPEPAEGRGRRCRPRPRRSAFLSVAAPSLAFLGVTAVATAATVSDASEEEAPVAVADDPGEVQPVAANQQFDSQLAGLTAAAGDYASRASRTQGRIDLREKRERERREAAAEAARREAMRPKYWLPVEQRGLSAYYGVAGVNWMSLHTGIDFPVAYGTPVKAATDGTIRTMWHVSYGNVLIITAPDGTETWYCHLSSTAFQSGSVKAGTVVAYSGNSGNSTGPHLHFEVHPSGGSAVDPLAWLRSHGLEPT